MDQENQTAGEREIYTLPYIPPFVLKLWSDYFTKNDGWFSSCKSQYFKSDFAVLPSSSAGLLSRSILLLLLNFVSSLSPLNLVAQGGELRAFEDLEEKYMAEQPQLDACWRAWYGLWH